MPSNAPLTNADLYELMEAADAGQAPAPLIARLLNAVDHGNLAEESGFGHALTMAGQLTASTGDLEAAERLFDRAIEAYRTRGGDDDGHTRAFRAATLLQQGREEDGMAALAALRPRLLEDPNAAEYIAAALADGGQLATAEQWLTEAMKTALDRRQALIHDPDSDDFQDATALAYGLLQARHEIRHELDLPHDEHDELAEQLAEAIDAALAEADEPPAAVLSWPRAEYDQLLARWPAMAEEFGADWDVQRTGVESTMAYWADRAGVTPKLIVGSVEGLAGYAAQRNGEPTDSAVLDGYEQRLAESGAGLRWPPGRNDACWCGSGQKYKKCCHPRGAH